MLVDASGICFPLGLWRLQILVAHFSIMFPSRCFSVIIRISASTSNYAPWTPRLFLVAWPPPPGWFFLMWTGWSFQLVWILAVSTQHAKLNTSKRKFWFWCLLENMYKLYFTAYLRIMRGANKRRRMQKSFLSQASCSFWSGTAEVRSTWLWWMVWRFRLKAMLGALVLHPNKIYKYSRSPPQKSEVLIKQT